MNTARLGMAVGAVVVGCGIGLGAAYMLDLFPGTTDRTVSASNREGGPVAAFSLTSHTGEALTAQDFSGKYTLVFFGFTFCPDVCPTTLGDMASVLDALGDDAALVQPLFISVDPDRDTPEQLATYVAAFDDRIIGLTGSKEQVDAAVAAYGSWYEFVPDEDDPEFYLVNHTAGVYFMDREGRFVRVFSYQTPTEEVVEGIRAIMREDAAV